MPIEILDIVVTVSVVEGGASGSGGGGGDKDVIIAECVERVLEILEEKSER